MGCVDQGRYYRLDAQGEQVSCSLNEWVTWYADTQGPHDDEHWVRRVAISTIGEWNLSTVFEGLNHNWGDGPPLLWESLVFGPPPFGGWRQRYSTRAQAEAGHDFMFMVILSGDTDARC